MAYPRGMRAVVLALASITVTVTLVLACSKPEERAEVDAGRGPGADAGSDASTLPYPLTQTCAAPTDAGNACSACNQTNCCQSRAKILPSSVDALVACMEVCNGDAGTKPSDDCQKRCLDGDPHQADYLEQFACLSQNCVKECDDGGKPCVNCMRAQCPLEVLACNTTPECFYMNACGGECGDGDLACTEACYRKHAAAKKVIDDQALCVQARCAAECANAR